MVFIRMIYKTSCYRTLGHIINNDPSMMCTITDVKPIIINEHAHKYSAGLQSDVH